MGPGGWPEGPLSLGKEAWVWAGLLLADSVVCAVQRDHVLCMGRKGDRTSWEPVSFLQSIRGLSSSGRSRDTGITHPCCSETTLAS